MAKQEKQQDTGKSGYPPVQRQAEEQPPVTPEAEQAPLTAENMPSGMVGSVVDSARAAASAAAEATEDSYIYNENTKETRVVKARAGYAPSPMPFGFRLATDAEIAAYKATKAAG